MTEAIYNMLYIETLRSQCRPTNITNNESMLLDDT